MSAPVALVGTAQVVARNLAPLAGVLFLGWSARNVLYLYFVDTLLAMAVIFAGVARHFFPPAAGDGWAARANAEAGALVAGLAAAAVVGVPLGVGLVFMLHGDLGLRETLADPGFRGALAWQALAAVWSYWGLWRELPHRSPEDLMLRRGFALVFLRWIAMLVVAYWGVGAVAGAHAALVFVALYAALSIWTEVAPDNFLRLMPGGADGSDIPQQRAAAATGTRRKRRRR